MEQVTFQLANEEERLEALILMGEWGWELYQCEPPPITGHLIIARHKEEGIVGTVAFDFADERTPFPLEALYDFRIARQQLPPFTRENTIQGGRWFARMPGVSYALLQALAEYVKPRGIQFMIVESKDYIIKRLEEMGLKLFVVNGVCPDIAIVPPEAKRYYEAPPCPQLVLIDIASINVMHAPSVLTDKHTC